MPFSRTAVLCALLGALVFTGFGCKKIEPYQPNTTALPAKSQVKLPTITVDAKTPAETAPIKRERKPEAGQEKELVKLRELMASFQKSESFRAHITIGGTQGINGEIAYSKPHGMFGKLFLPTGFTTEMAIQNQRVAVRSGTSTWEEITGNEEAARISQLFAAITNQSGDKPLYPSENTRSITSKDNTERNCRMYTLSHFMGNLNSYQPVNICIQNGLPIYFSVPSEDGLIEISYRDIDKPVEVFFPLR